MTINPKHFPDPEQWKTFAILLELADNGDADGNGVEKLQDFVMRAQVLLDHLLEHPEDIGMIGEYSPYPLCNICNSGKIINGECDYCGCTHRLRPRLDWVSMCTGHSGNRPNRLVWPGVGLKTYAFEMTSQAVKQFAEAEGIDIQTLSDDALIDLWRRWQMG